MSPRNEAQLEQVRQRSRGMIQNAALAAFMENGFDATSIAEIARRAGVSKGLIYNYYENKEALLRSVMEDRIREAMDTFGSIPPDAPPSEKLRHIIERTLEDRTERAELYRLYYGLLFQPDPSPAVRQVQESLRPEFAQMFGEMVKVFDELGSHTPVLDARALQASLIGLTHLIVLQPRMGPDVVRFRDIAEHLFELHTRAGMRTEGIDLPL